MFLDGPRRKDQGALTILGMEVLDPESGILQPTFNGITEDVFDLLVDESGLESNRVCAAQDGANRFNELAVQSVQFARVALQARLGELLSQKGENREKESEGEDDNQTKCTQAGSFILSKDFPYADDGDRDHGKHHQQRNVLAVIGGPESTRVRVTQDGSKHFSEITVKSFQLPDIALQVGFGELLT